MNGTQLIFTRSYIQTYSSIIMYISLLNFDHTFLTWKFTIDQSGKQTYIDKQLYLYVLNCIYFIIIKTCL